MGQKIEVWGVRVLLSEATASEERQEKLKEICKLTKCVGISPEEPYIEMLYKSPDDRREGFKKLAEEFSSTMAVFETGLLDLDNIRR